LAIAVQTVSKTLASLQKDDAKGNNHPSAHIWQQVWHFGELLLSSKWGALATALLHSSNSENEAPILLSHAPSKGKTFKALYNKNTPIDLFLSVLIATQEFSFVSNKMCHAAGLFTFVEYFLQ